MVDKTQKLKFSAVGITIAASLAGMPTAQADTSPFKYRELAHGYMLSNKQAETGDKKAPATNPPPLEASAKFPADGKCGEGLCASNRIGEGKCGE